VQYSTCIASFVFGLLIISHPVSPDLLCSSNSSAWSAPKKPNISFISVINKHASGERAGRKGRFQMNFCFSVATSNTRWMNARAECIRFPGPRHISLNIRDHPHNYHCFYDTCHNITLQKIMLKATLNSLLREALCRQDDSVTFYSSLW